MKDYVDNITKRVEEQIANKYGLEKDSIKVTPSTPPNSELGDVAYPMFTFSKILKMSPNQIANELSVELTSLYNLKCNVAGPYLNVFIDSTALAVDTINEILNNSEYGNNKEFVNDKIMIEFSCPNTNKPLHLGHMRNNSIGESVSRILKACGAEVFKVNLINDRGIHICKSMLAYEKFGGGKTPESENIKSDRFVGDYYVKYDKWNKEDPSVEEEARKLLLKWESGDKNVVELWKKMNNWAISGIKQTYQRCGIVFDKYYFESMTYLKGKEEILKGLEQGIFYKDADGSIKIDLADIKLDTKVLLRSDGTSLYITQDLGTAIYRHSDWQFNKLIYVVACEQQYHFKVLFHILKKLGYQWADKLFHLSYGMVNLPEGKMKSREGTVVDADDLLNQLKQMSIDEIKSKDRENQILNIDYTAESIALGALNYFLLSVSPTKDMIFNPKESLSFNGNTGPYMQYMGTRITSMLNKFSEVSQEFDNIEFEPSLLSNQDEKNLLKLLKDYPNKVIQAGKELNPSVLTAFLYDICKTYSKFYHDNQILNNSDKKITVARIMLSKSVLNVLKHAFYLLEIPYLEQM